MIMRPVIALGRLLEKRAFWTTVTTLAVGIMVVLGILCSIMWPGASYDAWSLSKVWAVCHYSILCLLCAGYAMGIFHRGNEYEWSDAWQFLVSIIPVVAFIHLYGIVVHEWAIFYFSGFIWVSGWLFLKWIYLTIPDE